MTTGDHGEMCYEDLLRENAYLDERVGPTEECMDYQQNLVLKAMQEEALFHLYNGRDVFAWFPTGYVKSICFQLILIPGRSYCMDFKLNRTTVPQVERSVVLVISPLVS